MHKHIHTYAYHAGERHCLIMWSTGPYRETDEYKIARARSVHGAGHSDVDAICLSYTHDPDYGEHKAYPTGEGDTS